MGSDAKSLPVLGFLTVIEHEQHGLFGGYLVLNLLGRPVEFHCTAPVKPNRAQQILFGPTLEPYLYGEQIGQTLISKASHSPLLVCTDQPPALAVREHIALPVVLVLPTTAETIGEPAGAAPQKLLRVDAAHARAGELTPFAWGRQRLAVSVTRAADQRAIAERLAALAESFDLAEPFGRIREAIAEAQRGAR